MESIDAVRASSQRYPDKTTALTGILHSGTPCRNDGIRSRIINKTGDMNRRVVLTLTIIGIRLLLGFAADMVQKWDLVFDDAFITYRYAGNLAAGHGITWNPGMAPTEGYTNFLLVILLAPFIHLGHDPLLITRLLSYLGVFGMAVMLFTRARRRYGATTPTAIMIAALIFLAPSTSDLCLTGLETVLYAFILLVAFHFAVEFLYAQDTTNSVLLGTFTLIAVLLRPEAALLYLVTAFMYGIILVRGKQLHRLVSLTPSLLILLIAGGAYLGWKALHFGQLLPNSFYIKVATGALISNIGLVSVYHFLSTHTLLLAVFCVSLLFCLSYHDKCGRSDRLSVLLGLGLVLSYALFFIKTDTHMDIGSRFMYALVPILIYSSIPLLTTVLGELEGWIKERALLFPVLVVAFMPAFGAEYATKIYGNVKRLSIYPHPPETGDRQPTHAERVPHSQNALRLAPDQAGTHRLWRRRRNTLLHGRNLARYHRSQRYLYRTDPRARRPGRLLLRMAGRSGNHGKQQRPLLDRNPGPPW